MKTFSHRGFDIAGTNRPIRVTRMHGAPCQRITSQLDCGAGAGCALPRRSNFI